MHPRLHQYKSSQAARRAWPRLCLRAGRQLLQILVAVTASLVALAAVLAMVAASRPLPIGPLVEGLVQARVGERFAAQGLRAESGHFGVSLRRGLVPVITARDLVLWRDGEAEPLVHMREAEAVLHRDSLALGQLSPRALRIEGLDLAVVTGGGNLALQAGRAPVLEAVSSPAEFVAGLDRILSHPSLSRLDTLGISGIELSAEDRANGWNWHSESGVLRVLRSGARLELDLSLFDVGQEGGPGVVSLRLQTDTRQTSGRLRLVARGLNPVQLVPGMGRDPDLSPIGRLDAPLSLNLSAEMAPGGELGRLEGQLALGAGQWVLPVGRVATLERLAASVSVAPGQDHVQISNLRLQSDLLSVAGAVQFLGARDGSGAFRELTAQAALTDLRMPAGLGFDSPVAAEYLDLLLRYDLAARRVTLGPSDLVLEGHVLRGEGYLQAPGAGPGNGALPPDPAQILRAAVPLPPHVPNRRPLPPGWEMGLDLAAAELPLDLALRYWPGKIATKVRGWAVTHLQGGTGREARLALRLPPRGRAETAVSLGFEDLSLQPVGGLPVITGARGLMSLQDRVFAVDLERAQMQSGAGPIALRDGLVLKADTRRPDLPLQITGQAAARLPAAVAFLGAPLFQPKEGPAQPLPFGPGDVAGALDLALALEVFTGPKATRPPPRIRGEGMIRDLRNATLVPGRALAAERLALRLEPDGIEIAGPLTLDGHRAEAAWSRALGKGAPEGSLLRLEAPLTQSLAASFGVPIRPREMDGAGRLWGEVTLAPGAAPRLALQGDLRGARLRLPALGWFKPRSAQGQLRLSGQLGQNTRFDQISLSAPGLDLKGRLRLADGRLGALDIDRARLGSWFDGAVAIRPAGPGQIALNVKRGALDLRGLPKAGGGGSNPIKTISLALDRLTVSEQIALREVRGDLSLAGGVRGEITGRVAGRAPVRVGLRPGQGGPRLRVTSADAGAVLRAAGLYKFAHGGALDLRLDPTGAPGQHLGRLEIDDTVIKDAPAAASFLSAISLVGLAEQAGSGGLIFGEVDAAFLLTPERVTVSKASATGPSLGLSLDGAVDLTRKEFDMQGVISPFYFVNRLGEALSRRGEGILGITFRLTGPLSQPKLAANPASLLTPGMFREIFRRPPPQLTTKKAPK